VQNFLPSPMATATAMYHSGRNPLKKVRRDGGETVFVPKDPATRRLHKAFLRYHDPVNWPLLRQALRRMGRGDLIGNGPSKLIPLRQPAISAHATGERAAQDGQRRKGRPFRTQHVR
jgi:hypothetical protein